MGVSQKQAGVTPFFPRQMEVPMPLSDLQIRNAKPSGKPQKLFDEKGLFLLIPPKGGYVVAAKVPVWG